MLGYPPPLKSLQQNHTFYFKAASKNVKTQEREEASPPTDLGFNEVWSAQQVAVSPSHLKTLYET